MNNLAGIVLGNSPSASHNGFPVTLTPRQRDVLLLLCEGLPNKLISRRLCLSDATVKTHVASILRGLNASNRLEAVILAFRLGLVKALGVRAESEPAQQSRTPLDLFAYKSVRIRSSTTTPA